MINTVRIVFVSLALLLAACGTGKDSVTSTPTASPIAEITPTIQATEPPTATTEPTPTTPPTHTPTSTSTPTPTITPTPTVTPTPSNTPTPTITPTPTNVPDLNTVYSHLPQIETSQETQLKASPSHPASNLSETNVPSDSIVRIIGQDKNGQWTLVLDDNAIGWIPTFYFKFGTANTELASLAEPRLSACQELVGGVNTLGETWTNNVEGRSTVEGIAYSASQTWEPKANELVVQVDGNDTPIQTVEETTTLDSGDKAVWFKARLDDIERGERVSFRLADSTQTNVIFFASFFGNDCAEDSVAALGSTDDGVDGEGDGADEAVESTTLIVRTTIGNRAEIFDYETYTEVIEIGQTVNGQPITAKRFGTGESLVIFVGGLHAGYAPSSVALAKQLSVHLNTYPDEVPSDVMVVVIESVAIDSPVRLQSVEGRLNANGVDLNRNWDCRWSAVAEWARETVSGGEHPFSEPETRALRDFILDTKPQGVIFWEAKSTNGLVSPGLCDDEVPVSEQLAEVYGYAAGYGVKDFEQVANYRLHGDGTNWLNAQGIPAAAVLLTDYRQFRWQVQLAGIRATIRDLSYE